MSESFVTILKTTFFLAVLFTTPQLMLVAFRRRIGTIQHVLLSITMDVVLLLMIFLVFEGDSFVKRTYPAIRFLLISFMVSSWVSLPQFLLVKVRKKVHSIQYICLSIFSCQLMFLLSAWIIGKFVKDM